MNVISWLAANWLPLTLCVIGFVLVTLDWFSAEAREWREISALTYESQSAGAPTYYDEPSLDSEAA